MTDKLNKQTESFWDDLYTKRERIWSGRANAPLINTVTSLQPGTALDLGCGEGGDAAWLAQHGWHVTAVDVSLEALKRTQQLVAEHDLQDRVITKQHDLEIDFPEGAYDLVSAQYLQSPLDFQRQIVLQKAAEAVAPNGRLLIVEHAAAPSWSDHKDHVFPTAQETFDSLKIDTSKWHIESIGSPERKTVSPSGEAATIKDNVIVLKRLRD